jgi:vacuolar-type H+-ATPase subunit E/Vma4
MSLDIIIAKVLDDARAEAGRIMEEHRRKADALLQSERLLGESRAEAVRRDAGNEAALEAGRIVTQARLERRIELLAARKALVDEVLERALAEATLRERPLSKTIVSREGETEEPFERAKLLDEIRPGLENAIAEILKI